MLREIGIISGVTTGVTPPVSHSTLWYDRSSPPYVLRWFDESKGIWDELIKGVTNVENAGVGMGQIYKQYNDTVVEIRTINITSEDLTMTLDETGMVWEFDMKEYMNVSDTHIFFSGRQFSSNSVIVHSNIDWDMIFTAVDWVQIEHVYVQSSLDGFIRFTILKENYTGQDRSVDVTVVGYREDGTQVVVVVTATQRTDPG
jgi:hypothetical protein